jgi:glyoxylase-like metal-dependent hydrolase (beta-lactamase superfamily II)
MRLSPGILLVLWSLTSLAQTPSNLQPDPPTLCSDCEAWNAEKEPSRVFGNTYSVGTVGLGSILITSEGGHILLDGGLPQSAPLIDEHIRKLGFRTEDIRLIGSSHAHHDHAGGIAALQRASGAVVAASPSGAKALERGEPTSDDPQFGFGPQQNRFPAVKNLRVVKDGEVLRVGDLAVTVQQTPGHTPGSTSWSWRSCEGTTCRNLVYADSLNAVAAPGFRFTGDGIHAGRVDEFRGSIAKVRALPCDVLLTVHPSYTSAKTCAAYADEALKRLDQRVADEEKAIRVAITVDDLPAHGPVPEGTSRLQIHRDLLAAFAAHEIREVYGFVNAGRAQNDPALLKPLEAWVAAGHPVGNHTSTHPVMEEVGLDAYIESIDANESILRRLMAGRPESEWKWFRYPFLKQGIDHESSSRIRDHLKKSGYRVAEVTIDFYDWAFNAPYGRCKAQKNEAAIRALRESYLGNARVWLQWADAAAREAFGRAIPHVLLLHVGAFDAVMMDELLTLYEKLGVEWIRLEDAIRDPVYSQVALPDRTHGDTLIDQAITGGAPHPPYPMQPEALLEALCPVTQ